MTTTLTINLSALASNWLSFKRSVASSVDCGAVVKADAYSLGMSEVVPALLKAGCRTFYVANFAEALRIKALLNEFDQSRFSEVSIVVLSGCAPGEEWAFLESRVTPVLVSVAMLERWCAARQVTAVTAPPSAILKLNTGMGRLGLEPREFAEVASATPLLALAGVDTLMSHLACADELDHPLNAEQLSRFCQGLAVAARHFRPLRGCFANSAGICLGEDYHFDAVRPGIGLYSALPFARDAGVDLQPVVELHLPVVQVRDLPSGESVGYGATYHFKQSARTAVVAGGYADGLFRALGNKAVCWVPSGSGDSGWQVPVVGRISMDTTILDISAIPEGVVREGTRVEFIGKHAPLERLADSAGTISYEVLTALGVRYNRHYIRDVHV